MERDKENGRRKFLRIWLCIGGVIAVGVILALYFAFDPGSERFAPKCPLLMATGLKCPGCGSQRMLHALLHGDIAAAWRCNALLFLLVPFLIALGVASARRRSRPRFYRVMNSIPVIVAVTLALIGWFVLRNFIITDL